MEKKVTKKFYYLSALNIIPALILAKFDPLDTLALMGVVVALVLNHTVLVNMVGQMSASLMASGNDAKQALKRTLLLLLAKMLLLGTVMGLIYFYNPLLIPKVMVLVIFQLIIQVVSIKNNY